MKIEKSRLNKHTGRSHVFTAKGCNTINDLIAFLEAVKKEWGGSSCVAIPRDPMEVTTISCGTGRVYDKGFGYDIQFTADQISTVLESVGEEVEW